MQSSNPFFLQAQEYDAWFDAHPGEFQAEVACLQRLMPLAPKSLEVGVGTGRFAQALGISQGVDPSPAMLALARQRNMQVVQGVAESLPWDSATFDLVTMITLLCFLKQPEVALAECRRVLRPQGKLLLAFLNPASALGTRLVSEQAQNPWYQEAKFHEPDAVMGVLGEAGFQVVKSANCLQGLPGEAGFLLVQDGVGQGLFTALLAESR